MLAQQILQAHKKDIFVVGSPGAGKTSMVFEMALLESSKKFLYLSFGSDNAKLAKIRMPQNVVSSSFHALAKQEMQIDSNRISGKFTMADASVVLRQFCASAPEPKLMEAFLLLLRFFCMSNSSLLRVHDVLLKKQDAFPALSNEERTIVLKAFKQYWASLWEPGATSQVTHDMYFKAFSLSAGTIRFDYLIVDECQDLNDTMRALVSRISMFTPDLKIIRLGDLCQQIYSFRGASVAAIQDKPDFALNRSLRFGRRLAALANRFMSDQLVSYYTPIASDTDHTLIREAENIDVLLDKIKQGFRPTVIARHNMTLWLLLKTFALQGIPCSLGRGFKHDLRFLQALYALKNKMPVSHPQLNGTSYARFHQQARLHHDTSMLLACRFVDSMGKEGGEVFSKIQRMIVSPKQAHVLLTTLHQAKGLEYRHVVLADDFPQCWDPNSKQFQPIEREEAHIIYTAITRAKDSLALPKSWVGASALAT
jgi:hypothetical protein